MKEIALRHMKALLLLLAVSACLSACSSEGPGEEGEAAEQSDLIIGAWIQRLRNGDYYEMEFWPSGGGTFDSNVGWTGTFRWKNTCGKGISQSWRRGRRLWLRWPTLRKIRPSKSTRFPRSMRKTGIPVSRMKRYRPPATSEMLPGRMS